MKIAQSTYTQAGMEIILSLYFDLKAFDFITPALSSEQEENFMRLVCDSLAAALPKEKAEKTFYIKRIFKPAGMNQLKILCTDGFLIDGALTLPLLSQAYSVERVKLGETDQLPARFKLSNDLIKNINERLTQFEEEARKNIAQEKIIAPKETLKQQQSPLAPREFKIEKTSELLSTLTQAKKEIKDLAENNITLLKNQLGKMKDTDADKEALTQKINEMLATHEKFLMETEKITENVAKKTHTLLLFKQQVIKALYESADQFHVLVVKKMQNAPSHEKKLLVADFNKKFSGIATLSESGELSSPDETRNSLENLSLENLQEIISSDSKETPGLLQKCNTSWTEESPELQSVMKQLTQLNKPLSDLFRDDPDYAHQEMIQIIRIPFPRGFQFKFSESAINYKNVIDAYCKDQKEALMNLVSRTKKILQIHEIREKPKQKTTKTEIAKKPAGSTGEIKKRKEVSDAILSLANKDHQLTRKHLQTAKQLHTFITTSSEGSLKLLIEKMQAWIDKIQEETNNADTLMNELIEIKSQIDIQINHHILHPDEEPDMEALDQQTALMEEKRNLLLSKNRMLEDMSRKFAAYEDILKRIQEIDLLKTKTKLRQQHDEAKQLLLKFIQQENANPTPSETLKNRMLEQYSKVDTSLFAIDKFINEISQMQTTLFTDLDIQPDITTERLETRFQAINEKMQTLSSAIATLNENVSGLKKTSMESNQSSGT